MSEEDFRQTQAIFEAARRGMRNDARLGDFLVRLGAELVALGVQENKREDRTIKPTYERH